MSSNSLPVTLGGENCFRKYRPRVSGFSLSGVSYERVTGKSGVLMS